MEKNEIHVTVTFEGKEYPFDNGSEAYIFHTGILNDLHKIYGTHVLPIYTAIVLDCYRTDGGHTPLGTLADYVATHWEDTKNKSDGTIIRKFYDHIEKEDEK